MVRTQVNNDGTTTVWHALNERCTEWSIEIVKGYANKDQIKRIQKIRQEKSLPFIYDPEFFNDHSKEGRLENRLMEDGC